MKAKPMTLAAVASALLTLPAGAQQLINYNPVSAIAAALYARGATSCSSATGDIELDFLDKTPGATNLFAAAVAGPAQAGAALNLPDVWTAFANASGGGASPGGPCTGVSATGIMTGRATIVDPLGRPSVKLHIKFKAASSSAPPTGGRASASAWNLAVASDLDDDPYATLDADGKVVGMSQPNLTYHSVLNISGSTGGMGVGDGTGASQICDSVGGCVYFDGWSTELATTLVFDAVPGVLWAQLKAVAAEEAFAIIDPVIEPDPANPEVVVTMNGPLGSGGFTQPMGVTADQLMARGIDPGPFIRLGFLEASPTPSPSPSPPPPATDTTAPISLASAAPEANALGWNKTAVSVTLSAIDNAGGSGAKEMHYSLDGASTGSQVVAGDSATVAITADGTTTLNYFAVDNAGNRETPKTLTVRIDKQAPTVTGLPSACVPWPPDHRLVEIASVSGVDAVSGLSAAPVLTATSNEPDDGTGDGDAARDVVIAGSTVQLRAERAGNGRGRVYTIKAQASDLAGNTTAQTAICKVPHDLPN